MSEVVIEILGMLDDVVMSRKVLSSWLSRLCLMLRCLQLMLLLADSVPYALRGNGSGKRGAACVVSFIRAVAVLEAAVHWGNSRLWAAPGVHRFQFVVAVCPGGLPTIPGARRGHCGQSVLRSTASHSGIQPHVSD